MEDHAVGLGHRDLPSVHDQQPLLQIRREEGKGSGILIQGYQMPVVREQRHILGIFPAHRQTQELGQDPALLIDPVDRRTVVARVGAAEIIVVVRHAQRACRGASRMIIVQRADGLNLFKEGIVPFFSVGINVDAVLQFMNDIEVLSVLAEFQMSGRALHIASDHVHQAQLSRRVVQPVHIGMIHSQIRHAQIVVVSRHPRAADMGTEIPFRHNAKALEIDLVRDLSHASVLSDAQDRQLSVMIARHEQILIFIVRGNIAAAHAVDGAQIDGGQAAVLPDGKSLHSEVRNGIQIFPVMGDRHIGGIGDLHLLLFRESPLFHVHVEYRNAVFSLIPYRVG